MNFYIHDLQSGKQPKRLASDHVGTLVAYGRRTQSQGKSLPVFRQFADFTIGRAWTSDYGDPHVPQDFDFIYPISPLHDVPANKILPPTLLLTADHDDRVVPMHSFKLAATPKHVAGGNPNPLLLRLELKAGHGAGKSTELKIKVADKWSFVAQTIGLKWLADSKAMV